MTWKGFTAAGLVGLAAITTAAHEKADQGARQPKVERDGPACELHRTPLGHPPSRPDIPPPCSGEPAPTPDGAPAPH